MTAPAVTAINQMALALLDCLNSTVAETQGGPVDCLLLAGDEVEHFGGTGDDCGQGWVKLNALYRSTNFPLPDQDRSFGSCFDQEYAAVFELGVIRCWPTFQPGGKPGDPLAKQLAALKAQDDAIATVQAVCCWVRGQDDPPPYLVGQWAPAGPEGGVVGGTLEVTIGIGVCCT